MSGQKRGGTGRRTRTSRNEAGLKGGRQGAGEEGDRFRIEARHNGARTKGGKTGGSRDSREAGQ